MFWEALKAATRGKCGKGIRKVVSGTTKLLGNWADFLKNDENKNEFFNFLTQKTSHFSFPRGKTVFATRGREIFSNSSNILL